ncbi:MAG: homoserine kinase [Gloeomargaritaceae cyanobacterium C42_A2020_066]|nr:homoserine kinase [Gloeomargaritaceae cyanobacterium C42_A2020_066]
MTVEVWVPATTANIGPGFDCLGAALNRGNRFIFHASPAGRRIRVYGSEAQRVATDERNLAYRAFVYAFQQLGQKTPDVDLEIHLGVPLARGLGSSATAIVGGLVGANEQAGRPVDTATLLNWAVALEGHPDNVTPALLGGCCLAVVTDTQTVQVARLAWSPTVVPVVAIPDFELSTATARQVLPAQVSRADAIFNGARVGLLVQGLATGDGEILRVALQDRLHQPYRRGLIRGYDAVEAAALAAGAYGLVISGAGPTLLALTEPARAAGVAQEMAVAWAGAGVRAEVTTLAIDKGFKVTLGAAD